jgi:hypothetical protein
MAGPPSPLTTITAMQVTGAAPPNEPEATSVAQLANNTVPWWQRELAKLPAMEPSTRAKYDTVPFPYDGRNKFYEAEAFNQFNADKLASRAPGAKEDMFTDAAIVRGDNASEIYARARPNGIAMLNRGAIRDPEKMLPRVDPSVEANRLFKVGASISDIQKYLPKTTDLMKMARERPSGLAFSIPPEKPPLYTEGVNCERHARLPSRASEKNQLFCINPIDPRELYDYRPHPLLDSVLVAGGRHPNGGGFGTTPNTVPPTTASAAQSGTAKIAGALGPAQ